MTESPKSRGSLRQYLQQNKSFREIGNDLKEYGYDQLPQENKKIINSVVYRASGHRFVQDGFVSKLWSDAVAGFHEKLPNLIEQDATPASILQAVSAEAESRKRDVEQDQVTVHLKVPGKNGREIKLHDLYGRIISCVKQFQFVGDIAVQADTGHMSIPWAMIRLCLEAAISKHETYGLIMEGMSLVSNLITSSTAIERLFHEETSELGGQVLQSLLLLYTSTLSFLAEAIKYFAPVKDKGIIKRVKRKFQALNPLEQDKVKRLLGAVSDARSRVDADFSRASAEKASQGIDMLLDGQERIQGQLYHSGLTRYERERHLEAIMTELRTPVDFLKDMVSEIYVHFEEKQYLEILHWLSPIPQEEHHSYVAKGRLKTSGAWLRESTEFRCWNESKKSSILWLRGFLGTGKTNLVSSVIDYLRNQNTKDNLPNRLAFFYCSSNEVQADQERSGASRADAVEVLRNIVKQLSVTQGGTGLDMVIKQKYDHLKSEIERPRKLNLTECIETIISLTAQFPITLVIDALDELKPRDPDQLSHGSRDDLLSHLGEVVERSSNPAKIFVSTRPMEAVERYLRIASTGQRRQGSESQRKDYPMIEVNSAKNGDDILAFIEAELEYRIEQRHLLRGNVDETLRIQIRDSLFRRSNGMFRHASLQINLLCNPERELDPATVLEELENLPSTITEIYERTIREIERERLTQIRCTAQNAFKWLLCNQQTLSANAFLKAISIELEAGSDKMFEPESYHLQSACRSLVVLDQESDTFQLAHLSVREHFEKMPGYDSSECHLVAADGCLRMMLSSYGSSVISRNLSQPEKELVHYASLYWPVHYGNIDFRASSEQKKSTKAKLKRFILQGQNPKPAFKKWISRIPEMIQELGGTGALPSKLRSLQASIETPLFIACVFGFPEIIEQLAKTNCDFSQCNNHGQCALALAVENNQLETVEALLTSNKVNVNEFNVDSVHQMQANKFSPVTHCASALQAAAVQGSKAMVEKLIEHGANPHLSAGYHGSILQAACLNGHKSIALMLLHDYKVDPNTQGGFYGNALQAASLKGDRSLVEGLVEAGACVSTPGGHFGSALMAAVSSGNKDVIEYILETADVNLRSSIYGTPLQRAADMNREDIIQLLIENGADINGANLTQPHTVQTNSGSSLAIAARSGHNKIVSLLLKRGAETDLSPRKNGFHILHQASIRGMIDLAEYCISRECDVNMRTDQGPKYHEAQKQMTPLAFACAEGHLDMVQCLLQYGASVQYDGDDVTTVQHAARRGHSDVIEALIKAHNFRSHDKDDNSGIALVNRYIPGSRSTALHESVWGSPKAVSILLNNGAVFRARAYDVTPLHIAAWEGRARIAEILTDHITSSDDKSGPGINAQNDKKKTALMDAAETNRTRIFSMLLKRGASYKLVDKAGNSVLHYLAWRDHRASLRELLQILEIEEDKKEILNLRNTSYGNTALQEALWKKHYEIARMLLSHGAQLAPNGCRRFFHRVTKTSSIDEIREIIHVLTDYPDELNKFLNHRNGTDGHSLLHDAAEHDRLDIAKFLLEKGADVRTLEVGSDIDPKTSLHVASWRGHLELVNLFLEEAFQSRNATSLTEYLDHRNGCGKNKTALMDAAEKNQPKIMEQLLRYGADWSLLDDSGRTALQFCISAKSGSCTNTLLEFCARDQSNRNQDRLRLMLNNRDAEGMTAILTASHCAHTELARSLLNTYHADYECYDNSGCSILHYPCQQGNREMLGMLLDCLSKDEDKDKFRRVLKQTLENKTALQASAVKDHHDMVDMLTTYGAQ